MLNSSKALSHPSGQTTSRPAARPWPLWIVVALFVFLALMALPVGWMMLRSPHGAILGMPVAWIERTPFGSWLIPGLFLFSLIGLGSVCAIYGLLLRPTWAWPQRLNPLPALRWTWTFATGMGLACMVWITVQVISLRMYFWMQPLIFGIGLAIVVLMALPDVRKSFAVERPGLDETRVSRV